MQPTLKHKIRIGRRVTSTNLKKYSRIIETSFKLVSWQKQNRIATNFVKSNKKWLEGGNKYLKYKICWFGKNKLINKLIYVNVILMSFLTYILTPFKELPNFDASILKVNKRLKYKMQKQNSKYRKYKYIYKLLRIKQKTKNNATLPKKII